MGKTVKKKTISKPLTTGKIAGYCHVDAKTVVRWIKQGSLKAYQLPGGDNRVKIPDFISFLNKYNFPIPADIKQHRLCRSILIVDDDTSYVNAVERYFFDHGYEIMCASNGFDAGFMLAEYKPQVVILDLKMPGLSGFEVARRICESDAAGRPHIIILSGYIDETVREMLHGIGVSDILEKPIDTELLLSKVKSLVNL